MDVVELGLPDENVGEVTAPPLRRPDRETHAIDRRTHGGAAAVRQFTAIHPEQPDNAAARRHQGAWHFGISVEQWVYRAAAPASGSGLPFL